MSTSTLFVCSGFSDSVVCSGDGDDDDDDDDLTFVDCDNLSRGQKHRISEQGKKKLKVLPVVTHRQLHHPSRVRAQCIHMLSNARTVLPPGCFCMSRFRVSGCRYICHGFYPVLYIAPTMAQVMEGMGAPATCIIGHQ